MYKNITKIRDEPYTIANCHQLLNFENTFTEIGSKALPKKTIASDF